MPPSAIVLGPTLETERLILRPPAAQDLDGWAEFTAHSEAARFLGGPQPRAVAWRLLATFAGSWALQGFGMFSVIEKASGRWIGRLGPWRPEGWPGTEMAWGLLPSAQGRGYALEGAATATDWAIETLGWTDIIHTIDPANSASIALARRFGATNRGPGRLPPPNDEKRIDIWGQSAAAWRARASARRLRVCE